MLKLHLFAAGITALYSFVGSVRERRISCHTKNTVMPGMQYDCCCLFCLKLLLLWLQVGHAGTLDPMATGLLIICSGRGTKQIDDFVAMEKAYSGTLRLGQATPSYDAMSDIEEELPWEHITGEHADNVACLWKYNTIEGTCKALLPCQFLKLCRYLLWYYKN